MIPIRQTGAQDVGALIQQLSARRTSPERFSVTMPVNDLANMLFAAYKAEVAIRGRDLVADEHTLGHIKAAARWLADPHGKPGLMLQGLYGNGKSTLMSAICNLVNWLYYSAISTERVSIRTVRAAEIVEVGVRESDRDAFRRLCAAPLLAIDDLGEEPAETICYGMVYTPVRELLLSRYARQRLTIVSTNLVNTPDNPQLARHYGERVVDRFREMMEIIVFRNASYRR